MFLTPAHFFSVPVGGFLGFLFLVPGLSAFYVTRGASVAGVSVAGIFWSPGSSCEKISGFSLLRIGRLTCSCCLFLCLAPGEFSARQFCFWLLPVSFWSFSFEVLGVGSVLLLINLCFLRVLVVFL